MDLLVGKAFRNAANGAPGALALAHGSRSISFGELDRAADASSEALVKAGIGLGDRLVAWGGSPFELATLQLGAARIGAVFAPLSEKLSVSEAAIVASVAAPSLVLVDSEHRGVAPSLEEATGGVPWMDLAEVSDLSEGPGGGVGVDDPEGLGGETPQAIFFTSGSTGRPKGVVVSHQATVMRAHPGSQLEPRGLLVCPFPLFHMAAWTLAFQQWFARGGLVITSGAGDEICRAIEEHSAARVYLIPAMWRRVFDHLDSTAGEGCDLSSVRFADSGTSATPPGLLEEIGARLPGATRRVFYGSTEAANVASLEGSDFARKPGSCGTPSPFVEVRLDDEGELQVRSPLLFDGYVDDAEATRAAFEDDWFRTGDRAEIDDDGFIFITGRTSQLIRTGGESVDPYEVEQVVIEHPDVADVAVVGMPDQDWGEVVCAVVVLSGSGVLTVEQLRAHCAGRLAPHKHPRRVEVSASIPRTDATLQIQRALIIEQLASSA